MVAERDQSGDQFQTGQESETIAIYLELSFTEDDKVLDLHGIQIDWNKYAAIQRNAVSVKDKSW